MAENLPAVENATPEAVPSNGTRTDIAGRQRVFYDGYWILTYDAPVDSLRAKKALIGALTRRLFNHVEHGIDIPGRRLDEARKAYETETDPEFARIKGAMLAGALFNRAMDIFTKLVELQECGVEIALDNALMRQCGHCLQEALRLGELVLHRSGDEGIDELWGEPFRAFMSPIEDFYEGRYIKIAQAMRDIDRITDTLTTIFATETLLGSAFATQAADFARHARVKCETLRTDSDVFDVWPNLVVAGERLQRLAETPLRNTNARARRQMAQTRTLVREGRDLILYIARARVSMPKSTREFAERCEAFRQACQQENQAVPLPPVDRSTEPQFQLALDKTTG